MTYIVLYSVGLEYHTKNSNTQEFDPKSGQPPLSTPSHL